MQLDIQGKRMMNRFFLTIFAFLLSADAGVAQTLDQLSITVVYLRQDNRIGTGFLIADSNSAYLVTAKHVASFLKPESVGTVGDSNYVPYSFSLADVTPQSPTLDWKFHQEADIALLRLLLHGKAGEQLSGRFIPLGMIEQKLTPPQRKRPLVAMGFPLALGTRIHFSPITSESKAASGLVRIKPDSLEPEQTFFLLDKPSIGGFSGAPVFLMPWPYSDSPALTMPEYGTRAQCVGIVKGTISDDTGGKLAAIVPVYYVLETIRSNFK